MKALLAIFCVISGVLFLVNYGAGIKCYVCNNYEHKKGCGHGDEVDDKFITDCDQLDHSEGGISGGKFHVCRKIVTFVDFDVNTNKATERIVRKCGHKESKYDDDCYYRAGFGGRQTTCSCTTDECNSQTRTTSVTATLVIMAIFASAARYF